MFATAALQRLGTAVVLVGCLAATAGCGNASTTAGGGSLSPAPAEPSDHNAFEVVGRYPAKFLGLSRPGALALGPAGNLYLTDFSQRVSVISPDGRVLQRWGVPGHGPGEFHFIAPDVTDPTGIAGRLTVGPDGSVYVSDSGNARVEVFTPDGRFVRQFGSYGHGDGQFLIPFDLVADDSGNVLVADDERQTLTEFSPTGVAVRQIGGPSTTPDLAGHFHFSMIDVHGRLLVANDNTGRILYIDRSGHQVDSFGGDGPLMKDGPCDVTVDDLGYTYVSPCGPGSTFVFDRTHRLVASWAASKGVLATAPRFGSDGRGFALGADGSVIVLRTTFRRS